MLQEREFCRFAVTWNKLLYTTATGAANRTTIDAMNLILALVSFLAGALLSLHHPLGQPLPPLLFLVSAAAAFRWPSAWLVAVPAMLPIVGLAPWSGWLTFEELDILVLSVAAGGYMRAFVARRAETVAELRTPLAPVVLGGLALVSVAISLAQGFADAGGFKFGWFQGYEGPMNSVRIGKSLVFALLMLPLFERALRQDPGRAQHLLAIGLAGGLGGASMAALAERLVYTELLNFSSDYRTTGLFWEMHVGGAALDGWLVLTLPFAVWAMRRTHTPWHWVVAAILLGLGAYASLTTFSRGVYLAMGAMLAVLIIGLRRAGPVNMNSGDGTLSYRRWVGALVGFAAMAACVFPNAGYRGLLALLGVQIVALRLPPIMRALGGGAVGLAGAAGFTLGAALVPLSALVAKGPYLIYGAVLAGTAGLLAASAWRGLGLGQQRAAVAAAASLCVLAGNVGVHWGGEAAVGGFVAAMTMVFLLTTWAAWSPRPLWPDSLRSQGSLFVAAAAVSGIVAVFQGGAYMGDRFAGSSQDLAGRIKHWEHGVGMLETPAEWAFGKGLGRFPGNYFFSVTDAAFPGSYHLASEGGNPFLTVTGSRHEMSLGKVVRVSQRLTAEPGRQVSVTISVRAKAPVTVQLELCDKHLLYAENCTSKGIQVTPDNTWQSISFPLDVAPHPTLAGLSPRFRVFSLGTGTTAGVAHIDNVVVLAADGRAMVANGDFGAGMAHWFFTSDRDHMPWHAKNVLVAALVDQGLVGVVVFAVLVLAALWRLLVGGAREQEVAPFLAAGLVAFLVVGMFDSLVDVPRVAFMFYFLAFAALLIGARPRARSRRHRRHGDKSGAVPRAS